MTSSGHVTTPTSLVLVSLHFTQFSHPSDATIRPSARLSPGLGPARPRPQPGLVPRVTPSTTSRQRVGSSAFMCRNQFSDRRTMSSVYPRLAPAGHFSVRAPATLVPGHLGVRGRRVTQVLLLLLLMMMILMMMMMTSRHDDTLQLQESNTT